MRTKVKAKEKNKTKNKIQFFGLLFFTPSAYKFSRSAMYKVPHLLGLFSKTQHSFRISAGVSAEQTFNYGQAGSGLSIGDE